MAQVTVLEKVSVSAVTSLWLVSSLLILVSTPKSANGNLSNGGIGRNGLGNKNPAVAINYPGFEGV